LLSLKKTADGSKYSPPKTDIPVSTLMGSAIGGTVGTAKGVIDSVKNSNNSNIPNIKKAIVKYLNDSIRSIKNGISLSVLELTKSLTEELTLQLKEQIAQIDTVCKQIESNLTLSEKEILQKKSILKEQTTQINALESSAVKLADEVTKF
jgi:hypothetical protein